MPRFSTHSGLYGWDVPEGRLKEVRKTCLILTAMILALTVGCGLIPTGVTRDNWVSFAGTAALLAVMLEIIAVGRFCLAKSQLDYRTFHSIHWMMDYGPLLHAMLMGVALVAGIIFCFRSFTGILDPLVLLGFAVAAAISLAMRRVYQQISTYKMASND